MKYVSGWNSNGADTKRLIQIGADVHLAEFPRTPRWGDSQELWRVVTVHTATYLPAGPFQLKMWNIAGVSNIDWVGLKKTDAPSKPSAKLMPRTASVSNGQSLDVWLTLDQANNAAGVDLTMTYDPAKFSYTEYIQDYAQQAVIVTNDAAVGKLRILTGRIGTGTLPTDAPFLTLKFQVKTGAPSGTSSFISSNVSFSSENGVLTLLAPSSAEVSISDKAALGALATRDVRRLPERRPEPSLAPCSQA
ncbi:Cohesin domain-containing protein [Paenibacillus sp. UNCCL117]|uniref:cohesin domain-containing protein n=1 Tax=unclassified Paenibacillus TaxID=185978 RepID=UPI00088C09D7|nr:MULTISPECIES: cohesin domain-containing protein [unclassified Paenibacillus]SDC26420.1 Cohesin domain-containing protein [Paenibacillus sp. cl123]SFW20079.1 Cohesin domain-containing protein [Paenibacillus sp. UNCCL117]